MLRYLLVPCLLLLTLGNFAHAVPIADPSNLHNMSSGATHGGPKAVPKALGGTDQICIFCHTPHSAAPDTPLWSRPDPGGMGSFPLYAQPLAIKTDTGRTGYDAANPEYPSGASRMCLSCHDGVTSIGILLGRMPITMEAGSDTITNASAIIDLATSHPISFTYNNDVVTNVLNVLKPGDYQLPSGVVDTPLDGAEQMQCTTCHDPHEDTRAQASYGNLPFWRHQGNANSYDDVCNSCHTGATAGSPPPIHNIP